MKIYRLSKPVYEERLDEIEGGGNPPPEPTSEVEASEEKIKEQIKAAAYRKLAIERGLQNAERLLEARRAALEKRTAEILEADPEVVELTAEVARLTERVEAGNAALERVSRWVRMLFTWFNRPREKEVRKLNFGDIEVSVRKPPGQVHGPTSQSALQTLYAALPPEERKAFFKIERVYKLKKNDIKKAATAGKPLPDGISVIAGEGKVVVK